MFKRFDNFVLNQRNVHSKINFLIKIKHKNINLQNASRWASYENEEDWKYSCLKTSLTANKNRDISEFKVSSALYMYMKTSSSRYLVRKTFM